MTPGLFYVQGERNMDSQKVHLLPVEFIFLFERSPFHRLINCVDAKDPIHTINCPHLAVAQHVHFLS